VLAINPAGGLLLRTRVEVPLRENPGTSVPPTSTYEGSTPEGRQRAAELSRERQRWGIDPLLPGDMLGLYTHKDLPTLTEADKGYFSYVLLHESGHLIGLRHTPAGCSPSTSVMTSTLFKERDKAPSAPTEEDKKAVRKLLGIQ
jgi:hypothetical protein